MFNSEKYIETCIRSILDQSFTDFELIIIDDCSTDRSAEIVESFEDPRINLYRNVKNLRCDITRNLGITIAHGKYIYFMDSDDAVTEKTLETLVTAADESGAEVVIMNSLYDTIGDEFKFPSVMKVRKRYMKNPAPRFFSDDLQKRFNDEYRAFNINWEPWTRIQRRDFLIQSRICFPNTKRAGDRLFHLAELCCAKKIQVINFCGYVYHHHSKQTVKTSTEDLLRINAQLLQPAFRFIDELFDSPNLFAPVSDEARIVLKTDAKLDYFNLALFEMYGCGLTRNRITEIIRESIMQSGNLDPEMFVSMINMLARLMFR